MEDFVKVLKYTLGHKMSQVSLEAGWQVGLSMQMLIKQCSWNHTCRREGRVGTWAQREAGQQCSPN